jgi:tRNA G18 (ribose-2'-O)-methylase SpoU
VNLNKPHDVAIVAQLVIAFGIPELIVVGTTLDPTHPKVVAKLSSWNVSVEARKGLKWRRVDSLQSLAQEQLRLVATTTLGGKPIAEFEPSEEDVFVLGGASGLSKVNVQQCDQNVTIPLAEGVPFLTVSGVVPLLVGHFLF